MIDEHEYDRTRAAQWADGTAAGRGFSRRDVLRTAALGATVAGLSAAGMRPAEAAEVHPEAAGVRPAEAASAPPPVPAGPIVKPLPPDLFTVLGTNAEMEWEAMRGVGYHTPVDRFFVRNHTSTPVLDRDTWRLRLFGTGLLGRPTRDAPIEISFADLRRLPTETYSSFIECAGNGRSFYTSQQGQTTTGTAWKLGAVGVARCRTTTASRSGWSCRPGSASRRSSGSARSRSPTSRCSHPGTPSSTATSVLASRPRAARR